MATGRFDTSQWTVTDSTDNVSIFEALGIRRGTIQWPTPAPVLPGEVGSGSSSSSGGNAGAVGGAAKKAGGAVAGSKGGGGGGGAAPTGKGAGGSPSANMALGKSMAASLGWTGNQWSALQALWTRESGWSTTAKNPTSGAYGIPQSLPASKMASVGKDWASNPRTQITWGLEYIRSRYGTPVRALQHENAVGWY